MSTASDLNEALKLTSALGAMAAEMAQSAQRIQRACVGSIRRVTGQELAPECDGSNGESHGGLDDVEQHLAVAENLTRMASAALQATEPVLSSALKAGSQSDPPQGDLKVLMSAGRRLQQMLNRLRQGIQATDQQRHCILLASQVLASIPNLTALATEQVYKGLLHHAGAAHSAKHARPGAVLRLITWNRSVN